MKCPNCHVDTPAGETFCSNCGAYLAPTAARVPLAVGAGATPAGGSSSGTSGLLTPGTRLQNGRYVIEKVLGQGGMGAALLAKDTRIYDKLVVIKELITESIDPAERQEDIRNFEQEVKTLVILTDNIRGVPMATHDRRMTPPSPTMLCSSCSRHTRLR